MDTDMERPLIPAKQGVCHATGHRDGKGRLDVKEELVTITTSEMNFADAMNACTPQGDVEVQRRCVDNYKKWLSIPTSNNVE